MSEIPVLEDLRRALRGDPPRSSCFNAYTIEILQGEYGRVVLFYLQGLLMAVWHMESGFYDEIPVILPEEESRYALFLKRFREAVRRL